MKDKSINLHLVGPAMGSTPSQQLLGLAVLLVNKFRNKFGVGGIKEAEIDKLIKEEIQ